MAAIRWSQGSDSKCWSTVGSISRISFALCLTSHERHTEAPMSILRMPVFFSSLHRTHCTPHTTHIDEGICLSDLRDDQTNKKET